MKIIMLGNRGYLGLESNKPVAVLSKCEARKYSTSTQANRSLRRTKKAFPNFDTTGAEVVTDASGVCA